jgi:hypothetical protein
MSIFSSMSHSFVRSSSLPVYLFEPSPVALGPNVHDVLRRQPLTASPSALIAPLTSELQDVLELLAHQSTTSW